MNDELVVSTGATPGSYDAMETAKPDEPVLTLQGGDPFAPPTVLHWAGLARAAGLQEEDSAKSKKLLLKASAAEFVAWAMQDYQRGHVDAPEPTPATVELPDRVAEDMQALRVHAATRIYNSIAEMTDIAEALDAKDGDDQARWNLRCAVESLQLAAGLIEPRRTVRG